MSMERNFTIGAWRVNPGLGEIKAAGKAVRLEPRVMDVLLCLAARPGRVVSKETLIATVWADAHVAEAALTSAIWKLRQAFGDDPKDPAVIETVPRRGYRLLPPVTGLDSAPVEQGETWQAWGRPPPAARVRSWAPLMGLTLVALLLGVLVGFELGVGSVPASSDGPLIDSLALLPLEVRSGKQELAILGEGIVHGASIRLSQLDQVKVISGPPTQRYAGADVDATQVARELGVRGVLTGFVTDVEDELVVYIELLDGTDNSTLWGKRFRRRHSDVLNIEEEFSVDIATALGVRLSREEASSMTRRYTDNVRAYNLFQLARFSCKHEEIGTDECIDLYQEAIDLDPGYALAWAGLATVYFGTDSERPQVAMPLAERYARRALELEPDLAEARHVLAKIQQYYHWEWDEARRGLDELIRLHPNDAHAYHSYASLASQLGDTETALAMVRRARELDPLSPTLKATEGTILLRGRRHEEAIALLEATAAVVEEAPDCQLALAEAYLRSDRFQQALPIYERFLGVPRPHPGIQSQAGYAFALAGRVERATEQLEALLSAREEGYVPASWVAAVLVGLSRHREALDWLETGLAERDPYLVYLKVAATWDPLRSDPRFQQLYGSLNFPG